MIDMRALHDDLVEGMIIREYQIAYPEMTVDFMDRAIDKYQNDPIFHARVESIVAGITQLVQKHETTGDASDV